MVGTVTLKLGPVSIEIKQLMPSVGPRNLDEVFQKFFEFVENTRSMVECSPSKPSSNSRAKIDLASG